MQLKNESFIGVDNHFDDFNFFYKKYYENGLLKSNETRGNLAEFEYTVDGKILVEKISQDNGGGDDFFKSEYKYEGLTARSFHYKTGYSEMRDNYVPDETYSNLSRLRNVHDGPLPIYPLNELLSIEELIYNESKEIITRKKTNLKKNCFSEEKRSFDDLGNLINRVYKENNIIQSNSTYNYKNGVLESFSVDNAISYLKYNQDGRVIEIDCFEIVDGVEVFYSKTVLEYLQNRLISVNFNASNEEGFRFNDELEFFGWESLFEEESKSALKLNCLLNPYYDYFQKNYEVKFIYGLNNEIKQSTVINTQKKWKTELDSNGVEDMIYYDVEIEEARFFIYKYKEGTKKAKNSENILFIINPVEYIDGFTIIDNQIEHMFTHKLEYYE